jgi:WD40 repeat protein
VVISNEQNYQINGIDKKFQISTLSINNNDSLTSIILSNGRERLYYILNIFQLDSEISPIQPFFPCGFHSSKINSISISRCRSIFATVGVDNSIRLWTYEIIESEEKRGILHSPNQDNPVSISVHPYGFFIAVAFVGGFKVYTL